MFPWVYGFSWSVGNIIFLGTFFIVLAVVCSTIITALRRATRDRRQHLEDTIRWHEDFHDLPSTARSCRHVFTGEFKQRLCEREFDCRKCTDHEKLARMAEAVPATQPSTGDHIELLGMQFPLRRLYHRGHTWIEETDDHCLLVGLDGFACRVIGQSRVARWPAEGERIAVNGGVCTIGCSNGAELRVLSPVDGIVVALGEQTEDWLIKVKPDRPLDEMTHLLRGAEVRTWLVHELERLQSILACQLNDDVGFALADGGALVDDLPRTYPGLDWASVGREFLLGV